MNKLIILMGNIASGKTTVCNQLVNHSFIHLGIDHFYPKATRDNNIKKFWEDAHYCTEAYTLMLAAINDKITETNVVIESTGASNYAMKMFKKLENIPKIKIYRIFIKVPINILYERLQKRNSSDWPIKNTEQDIVNVFQLLKERKPKIDYFVNGNQETEKIVKEILEIIG